MSCLKCSHCRSHNLDHSHTSLPRASSRLSLFHFYPKGSIPYNEKHSPIQSQHRYDDLGWTSAALNDPDALIPPDSLLSAADPGLTAFAQLVVYRLAATRALISLFDRDRQHVVAEATPTSPVAAAQPPAASCPRDHDSNDDDAHDSDQNRFWLCGTAIPRSYGICEHVLLSSEEGGTTDDDEDEDDQLPVSVIPDLATDPRFQTRPYVRARPSHRFYAGVPLRTPGPNGVNIGVLGVFSTQPRPAGLDRASIAFVRDMARTIMGYLECRIALRCFRRAKRMNQGMGHFVEGLDSLASTSSASCATNKSSAAHSKRSSRLVDSSAAVAGDGIKGGGAIGPNGTPDRSFALPPKTAPSGRVIDEALMSPRTITPAASSSATRDSIPIVVRASSSLELSGQAEGSGGNPATAAAAPTGPRPPPPSASSPGPDDSSRCSTPRPSSRQSRKGSLQPAVLSEVSTADLQLAQSVRVFAKAANIIRQSLEIDGVLFLDATVRSFGGLVGQQSERKASTATTVGGAETTVSYLSNDEDSTAATQTTSVANKEDFCHVLGFSTPEASSIGGDSVPWQFEGLRDRTLQRLLRRYPQGQIFSYEADGSLLQTPAPLDGGEPSTPGVPPKRPASPSRQWSHDSQGWANDVVGQQQKGTTPPRQRWNAAESIAHLFPGARSVIIVPLWDSQKKRWAAGGFAWTNQPTRVFSVGGSLAFLRVFGLIVMAELYRLDTKAEETIKSNILGSISHELRSPLHGLVGAVELLHDSKLDAVQKNVVGIIETSGKTLVDTINHLLDYSKINSFIESDRAETKKDTVLGKVGAEPTERSVQEKARSQTLPVELDCLVEEVVEAVQAGYSHERLSRPPAAREYGRYGVPFGGHSSSGANTSSSETNPTTTTADSSQDRVQVYLDIEPSTSWRFRTHPGAFRRIVMNLFGNSLKFTKSGFIKITLAQEPAKPYQNHSRATVLLTVADSGKGISEDYLRNHLFTPFCQEDNFAPGTGLGLSLVRQITVNLGGEVKVASQVGKGTTITVTLPLPTASEGLGSLELTESRQVITRFKGRKVLLRGFGGVLPTTTTTLTTSTSTSSDLRPRSNRGTDDLGKMLNSSQAYYLEVTCRKWLEMEVLSEQDAQAQQPDFIIHQDSTLSFAEAEVIAARAPCPVLFVCDATVAVRNFSWNLPDAHSRIRTFEFFSAPLGPRKLAKGLAHLQEMWKVKQEQHNDAVHHHTASAEELSIVASGSTEGENEVVAAEAGSARAAPLSTQEVEVGKHTTVLKSSRASVVRDEAAHSVNQKKESPLPTPPDEPSIKYPITKSDLGAGTPRDGLSTEPSVLIVDDNAINLKVSHSKQATTGMGDFSF